MKKVYFILDKTDNNYRVSSFPFQHMKLDDDSQLFQMLRDIYFNGLDKKDKIISFLIVSIEVKNHIDFVMKSMNFLEKYKVLKEQVFEDENFEKILDINYVIDIDNKTQVFQNAVIRFSINEIVEEGTTLYYYSNPEIKILYN